MSGTPTGRAEPPNPVRQVSAGDRSFREYTLEEYLAAVAARRPAPSGGAAAAVTVAAAAGLVAMVARYSAAMPGASELVAEADAVRGQVLADADADAAAYAEVFAAYRLPRTDPSRPDSGGADSSRADPSRADSSGVDFGRADFGRADPSRPDSGRAERIRAALAGAAEVPLRIAAAGARVAAAGARAAAAGNPNLAGDAATAVLLAEAATRAATELVRINTRLGDLDPAFLAAARTHRATATAACRALRLDHESD